MNRVSSSITWIVACALIQTAASCAALNDGSAPLARGSTIAISSDPPGATVYIQRGQSRVHVARTPATVRLSGPRETVPWNLALAHRDCQPVAMLVPGEDGGAGVHVRLHQRNDANSYLGRRIAYSLGQAELLSRKSDLEADVKTLGGINYVDGVVVDGDDVILVGRHVSSAPALTISEFASALRARYIHKAWPLVSIDPSGESQNVRFEGGIRDSSFGYALFDADYRMKLIGMGHLSAGVPAFPSHWRQASDSFRRAGPAAVDLFRFWFYPVAPLVSIRSNVAAIGEMRVEFFMESLAGRAPSRDVTTFTRAVNDLFPLISAEHASLSRLAGLSGLVSAAMALEEMGIGSEELDYWLRTFEIEKVRTPSRLATVRRESLHVVDGHVFSLEGGVTLTALALRLRDGDVSALREAVLQTRPSRGALSWQFSVARWVIPTSIPVDPGQVAHILAEAIFLAEMGRPEEASALTDVLVEAAKELAMPGSLADAIKNFRALL